jgi:hypothetical protein
MHFKTSTSLCLLLLACDGRDRRPGGTSDARPDSGADSGADDRGSIDLGTDAAADAGDELDGGLEADTGSEDSGTPASRRIFITSDFFDGNLLARAPGSVDGLAAGDQLCREAALRASLGGDWRAWLSSDTVDAIDRIQDLGPWYDLEGTLLFDNLAELPDGPQSPIWYDEAGQFLASDRIWTGTIFDGSSGPMIATCTSWTSGAMGELARIGQVGRTGDAWTFQTMTSCDQSAHLICFEQ